MSTQVVPMAAFLMEVMRRKKRLPSQMAADLGTSHATVSRWLSGEDKPSTESCRKLADYSGESLQKILSLAGHMPGMEQPVSSNLPEFREYVRRKYPNKLEEDLVTVIEDLIECRRV